MVPSARKAAMRMGPTECIDRAASPQGLLSLRYIDGTFLSSYSPQREGTFKVARDGRSESGLHATLRD